VKKVHMDVDKCLSHWKLSYTADNEAGNPLYESEL
jgi:hypothetical protein